MYDTTGDNKTPSRVAFAVQLVVFLVNPTTNFFTKAILRFHFSLTDAKVIQFAAHHGDSLTEY